MSTIVVNSYAELALLLKREHQRVKDKGNKANVQDLADLVTTISNVLFVMVDAEARKERGDVTRGAKP